jgi:hypothetical protein
MGLFLSDMENITPEYNGGHSQMEKISFHFFDGELTTLLESA